MQGNDEKDPSSLNSFRIELCVNNGATCESCCQRAMREVQEEEEEEEEEEERHPIFEKLSFKKLNTIPVLYIYTDNGG